MNNNLFSLLSDVKEYPFSSDVYFIGGTALEILVDHRDSYDIDLVVSDNELDRVDVERFIKYLENKGRSVKDTLSIAAQHNFINEGLDVYDYQQNFDVDKVKLSIFSSGCNDFQQKILKNDKCHNYGNIKLVSIDAIFKLKSLVLIDRHKSRDLFDLHYLITKNNFITSDIFSVLNEYRPYSSPEIAISRLISTELPLSDEGLGDHLSVDINDITSFFEKELKKLKLIPSSSSSFGLKMK